MNFVLLLAVLTAPAPVANPLPLEIGSRLELLVDDHVIDRMSGAVRLELHRPVRREIAFRTDALWEGNASCYQSLVPCGKGYRIYYRGGHYLNSGPAAQALPAHPWFLCVIESDDGIVWRRPKLGLIEFNGSRANNIVLGPVKEFAGDPAHSAVFYDTNPNCPPDEKYKIVLLGRRPPGAEGRFGALYAMKSADGLRFTPLSLEPIITGGAFDSQNLAFWDPTLGAYREYHRGFNQGVRDIMTAVSKDFRKFPNPEWIKYTGSPVEQLYTNQVQPYPRAPHLLVGFPMRYTDRGWSDPMFDLPGMDERVTRGKSHPRYATAVTDAVFMTSRDGKTFHRWPEAFLRPGPREKHSWVYGDNFVFWGIAETKSNTEDAPNELTLYATESGWEGTFTSFRRYTLRTDGFVSAAARASGGELLTKSLRFEGGNLALNFETSGAGGVQVEVQDSAGKPLEGYALADCPPIAGDRLRHIVRWKGRGGDLRPLAGKAVRLRFVLKDADLYALQFVPYTPDPVRPAVKQPK